MKRERGYTKRINIHSTKITKKEGKEVRRKEEPKGDSLEDVRRRTEETPMEGES